MGEAAIPALVAGLGHRQNGWTAAMVLSRIGAATPEAIEALRAGADKMWFAVALGRLGDHAWLIQRGGQVAVWGLCAGMRRISTGARSSDLDYRPLEGFLDQAPTDLHKAIEEELKPGSGYAEISARDVDEAVRGLASRHAVVRWHATSVLGNRDLGTAVGKRVLPLLAERLKDPHAVVRRLAVIGIDRWKKAGQPYRPQIECLRNDVDATVRAVVESVLRG